MQQVSRGQSSSRGSATTFRGRGRGRGNAAGQPATPNHGHGQSTRGISGQQFRGSRGRLTLRAAICAIPNGSVQVEERPRADGELSPNASTRRNRRVHYRNFQSTLPRSISNHNRLTRLQSDASRSVNKRFLRVLTTPFVNVGVSDLRILYLATRTLRCTSTKCN